jgi:integrase/recombinase XerD
MLKEYRAYLKLEKGLSVNSVDAYLRDYQRLKDYADVHGIDVVHASFDDLQAFVFDTFKETASVRTQARLVAGIHSFYRFLHYHHYIEQDP